MKKRGTGDKKIEGGIGIEKKIFFEMKQKKKAA